MGQAIYLAVYGEVSEAKAREFRPLMAEAQSCMAACRALSRLSESHQEPRESALPRVEALLEQLALVCRGRPTLAEAPVRSQPVGHASCLSPITEALEGHDLSPDDAHCKHRSARQTTRARSG